MTRTHAAIIGILGAFVTSAPAFAQPGSVFDLRYAYELHNWSVPGADPNVTGVNPTALTFAAPMHTFTVTDYSGALLGFASALARTEGGRMRAREEAIRRRDTTYSYAVYGAEPKPGLGLGLTLGTGALSSFGGVGVTSPAVQQAAMSLSMMRLFAGSDMFRVANGTLAWDTSLTGYTLQNVPTTESFRFNSSVWALGLSYRMPVLNLPVLLEPNVHLDAGRFLFGGFKYDAYDLGLNAAYVLHPSWRIEGRVNYGFRPTTTRWGSGSRQPEAGLASVFYPSVATVMTF